MFGITVDWWILYALIVVIAFLALRIFMNRVSILGVQLGDVQNNIRELDGPEILRELRAIKYIIEGLGSDYDGFVLKERADSARHQK